MRFPVAGPFNDRGLWSRPLETDTGSGSVQVRDCPPCAEAPEEVEMSKCLIVAVKECAEPAGGLEERNRTE